MEFLVNGVLGRGDGTEALLASDGVDAVEACLSASNEEGADASADILYYLSLAAGGVTEVSGSSAGTTETVSARGAGKGTACQVWAESRCEWCSTTLGDGLADLGDREFGAIVAGCVRRFRFGEVADSG